MSMFFLVEETKKQNNFRNWCFNCAFCPIFVAKMTCMKESLSTVFAILVISCSLAVTACKHQPSALERRKSEIKEKDSIELSKAREGLRVADSVATFKAFEVEDLKKLFVFEKQEKYQTVGYYVLPAYQGSKERFTFFPEVEEGGKLLFVCHFSSPPVK